MHGFCHGIPAKMLIIACLHIKSSILIIALNWTVIGWKNPNHEHPRILGVWWLWLGKVSDNPNHHHMVRIRICTYTPCNVNEVNSIKLNMTTKSTEERQGLVTIKWPLDWIKFYKTILCLMDNKLKAVVSRLLSRRDHNHDMVLCTRSRGTTPQNLFLDTLLTSSRGSTHQRWEQVEYKQNVK